MAALWVVVAILAGAADVTAAKISLDVHYPLGAQQRMFVRGSLFPLNWTRGVPCATLSAGLHRCNIDLPPTPSVLEVKTLIDDRTFQVRCAFLVVVVRPFLFTLADPSTKFQVGPNERIRVVGSNDRTVSLYPFFRSPKGRFEIIPDVFSPQLGNSRNVIVYIPASYDENPLKPYDNVLLMHDGQNLFDPETAFMHNPWWLQNAISKSLTNMLIEEMYVLRSSQWWQCSRE